MVWWRYALKYGVAAKNEAPGLRRLLYQRWGIFDTLNGANSATDFGGLGLATMLHEVGHSLGLAHPHDGGGTDATLFPGVTGKNDSGDNGLNLSHLQRDVLQLRLRPRTFDRRSPIWQPRWTRRVRHRGGAGALRGQHDDGYRQRHLQAADRQCSGYGLEGDLGCRRRRYDQCGTLPRRSQPSTFGTPVCSRAMRMRAATFRSRTGSRAGSPSPMGW